MSQSDLATRAGLARKTVNEIINAKAAITAETALRFERIFNQSAKYWLNLEHAYRSHLARVAERREFERQNDWLKAFPIKEMCKFGWIKKREASGEQVEELLSFFGLGGISQWDAVWKNLRVAYRKSDKVQNSIHSIAVWLRQGELAARQIESEAFSKDAFRDALSDIRKLTLIADPNVFIPRLVEVSRECGVRVALVPEPPKAGVWGATYWIADNPVIQLSLRYKSDDHLWFTFFHEAGHILLHNKKELFLEGKGLDGEKEDEANRFAAKRLIPQSEYREFLKRSDVDLRSIQEFARSISISPGIVVGRLQHDGIIPFHIGNKLKVRYRWSHD